jgi:HK97 family phage prohead protease
MELKYEASTELRYKESTESQITTGVHERRLLASTEIRASAAGSKLKVSGYAATYGTLSRQIQPGLKERIAKRAFDKVLRSSNLDCVATFNHNKDVVLGRTSAGTLRLRSDDHGLGFECDLPDTTAARDLHVSVQRGDIKDMSFGFALGADDADFDEQDDLDDENKRTGGRIMVRTIRNFSRLDDVSLVTSAAYPGTSVDARSLPVEVRSHLATFRNQAVRGPVPIPAGFGVYKEDAADQLIIARRRAMTSFLLS